MWMCYCNETKKNLIDHTVTLVTELPYMSILQSLTCSHDHLKLIGYKNLYNNKRLITNNNY